MGTGIIKFVDILNKIPLGGYMKRTKIVCTVGPGTDKFGILEDMMRAGMNVARFNFSHGSHEEQAERMQMVRDAAMIVNKPIALLRFVWDCLKKVRCSSKRGNNLH